MWLNTARKPPTTCDAACVGNTTQACGSSTTNSMSLWGVPTVPGYSFAAVGCYQDPASSRALAGVSKSRLGFAGNSQESCADFCLGTGAATFFGVEGGGDCYCGTGTAAGAVKEGDANCQTVCTGDQTEKCGGTGHISIYSNTGPLFT